MQGVEILEGSTLSAAASSRGFNGGRLPQPHWLTTLEASYCVEFTQLKVDTGSAQPQTR